MGRLCKDEERPLGKNNPQRSQSNNSILFQSKPTRKDLEKIFDIILESGGSEPWYNQWRSC